MRARVLGGFGLRIPEVFADAAECRRWNRQACCDEPGFEAKGDAWPVSLPRVIPRLIIVSNRVPALRGKANLAGRPGR